jgi:hypothetical protein
MFPYSLIKDRADTLAIHRYGGVKTDDGKAQVVGILLARRPQPNAGE